MLLPTNMDPINLLGFSKNEAIKRLDRVPFFLFTSTSNLLAEIKAISDPEKKADRMSDMTMTNINIKRKDRINVYHLRRIWFLDDYHFIA